MKLVLEVPRDELPDIYIDCGTKDFLFDGFRAFTKILRDNKIHPHRPASRPADTLMSIGPPTFVIRWLTSIRVMRALLAEKGLKISSGQRSAHK